ncbi:MAG: SpoVA/SpoVAEb family sporulation membrane protein [Erysipelotrichales bacterium]|nr:SpoVA/SpoVAEb family sporulation membrane protein [Erysipelotrichales bacterium]
MTYLFAFLFAGLLCLIAQVIFDNTKLTPGHITSIYVVVGVLLTTCGAYEWLLKMCGGGAMTPITNFGYVLGKAALEGAKEEGVFGILKNMIKDSSAVLSFTVVMAFFATLVSKPRP